MKITPTDIAIITTYLVAMFGLTLIVYLAVKEPKKS